MKANYQNIKLSETSSLLYFHYKQTVKDIISLHFHPEYELTYVIQGSGKRIVGGQIEYFESGDLIFINSNIPHCWLYENERSKNNSVVENLVIQFKDTFIHSNFIKLPEFKLIQKMFNNLKSGFVLKNNTQKFVAQKMLEMADMSEFNRLITLFNILYEIANCDNSKSIEGFINPVKMSATDMNKFQKAYSYILKNYNNDITLESVANEIAMSETGFCRFFKKIARKTFIEFLNEYRIGIACKLLRETDKSVLDICFLCGFSDAPHFNRTFKRLKLLSPLQYRKIKH